MCLGVCIEFYDLQLGIKAFSLHSLVGSFLGEITLLQFPSWSVFKAI